MRQMKEVPGLKDDPTVALYGGGYPLYKDGKSFVLYVFQEWHMKMMQS